MIKDAKRRLIVLLLAGVVYVAAGVGYYAVTEPCINARRADRARISGFEEPGFAWPVDLVFSALFWPQYIVGDLINDTGIRDCF